MGFFVKNGFSKKKSSAKKAPFFSSDFIRKNTFSSHFCHITSRENKIEQNRFSQKKGHITSSLRLRAVDGAGGVEAPRCGGGRWARGFGAMRQWERGWERGVGVCLFVTN